MDFAHKTNFCHEMVSGKLMFYLFNVFWQNSKEQLNSAPRQWKKVTVKSLLLLYASASYHSFKI